MPHRYDAAKMTMIHAGEFLGLSVAAVVTSINQLVDQESWDRLTGRHGALFFMAVALIIFWNSNRVRVKRDIERQQALEAKEDARREAEEQARQAENEARDIRHKEAMDLQKDNSAKLIELTVENIKAQAVVAHALDGLKEEIRKCPKMHE
jgi:hypothetical protein